MAGRLGDRAPGTTCELRMDWWEGAQPVEGDFLRTGAGSCYRIDRIAGRTLHCTRLERDAVALGEPGVWRWSWSRR